MRKRERERERKREREREKEREREREKEREREREKERERERERERKRERKRESRPFDKGVRGMFVRKRECANNCQKCQYISSGLTKIETCTHKQRRVHTHK